MVIFHSYFDITRGYLPTQEAEKTTEVKEETKEETKNEELSVERLRVPYITHLRMCVHYESYGMEMYTSIQMYKYAHVSK